MKNKGAEQKHGWFDRRGAAWQINLRNQISHILSRSGIEADTERRVTEGLVPQKYGFRSAAKNKTKQHLKNGREEQKENTNYRIL